MKRTNFVHTLRAAAALKVAIYSQVIPLLVSRSRRSLLGLT